MDFPMAPLYNTHQRNTILMQELLMTVNIVNLLANRYSTKMFDPNRVADEEKIEILKETLRLAPSSINSQPWHFFVISSAEFREKLVDVCWDSNKGKMTSASHIFIFTAKTDFTPDDVKKVEALTADVRGEPLNETRLAYLNNYLNSMEPAERANWVKHQIYLPLGQLLMSAALLDLDSCPIEGFHPEEMDQLLGLNEKGLTSVAMVAIGHRDPEDFNQPDRTIKARFPMEDVLTEIR
ncbi:hypothetical protein GZ77_11740 [Endozoicomonas montiporae]|uniref:Nitroreductase domain-containing protein n=2 Tax=Endozoicomonas montiporae TaxID=1027273 RepID=A0A081N8Z8_9GAMM|nr:nitroreductase family protein [Endozoicomonas montiporae]KEQ14921.1 hypothetical protein GZ77_11740 [Endozoicomonas montiporae]